MALHGRSRYIALFGVCTHGFSAYRQVVALERVGVGGVVLISLCLCVLACERQRTRDSEGVCVKHGRQGKCFVLWEFSSGCQAPVLERRGDV